MPKMSSWMPLEVIESRAEQTKDIFRYLRKHIEKFDLTEALYFCASLNLIVSDGRTRQSDKDQVLAYQILFLDEKCRNKIAKWSRANPRERNLIARPQLIELFKWIGYLSSDLHGNVSREMPNDFLKAILSAGQVWQARQLEQRFDFSDSDNNGSNWESNAFKALPAIREMMLWSPPGGDPVKYLGRTKILLIDDMFARNPEYAKLFKQSLGVDLQTHIACLVAIETLGFPIRKNHDNPSREHRRFGQFLDAQLWQNIPAMQSTFETVLSQLAMAPDEWKSELSVVYSKDEGEFHDVKLLHQKPMMRDRTGRCVIVDQRLFVECATVGPVFMMASKRNPKEVFGQFGMAFERYARKLFNLIYGRIPHTSDCYFFELESDRSARVDDKLREISDVVIREGNSLVLAESKAVFPPKKILREEDARMFWAQIRQKYGIGKDEKTGKETRQGVAQLADAVMGLADGNWIPSNSAVIDQVNELFPVLVVYDWDLRFPPFHYFFAKDFAELLGQSEVPKSGFIHLGRYKIHNLVLLTVDEVEMWEFRLSTKPLADLLREFSQLDPQRRTSFRDYLLAKVPKLAQRTTDSWLNQEAIALLDLVKDKFFPEEVGLSKKHVGDDST